MAHKHPGTMYYLCINEPLKFAENFSQAVAAATDAGFLVNVSCGGPEAFPVHQFTGKELLKKKLWFMFDSIFYWSRMSIEVLGRSEAENKKAQEKIVAAVESQLQIHA